MKEAWASCFFFSQCHKLTSIFLKQVPQSEIWQMSKIKPLMYSLLYSLLCKIGTWIFHALPEECLCCQCLRCCHFILLYPVPVCSHYPEPVYKINKVLWMKDIFFPPSLSPQIGTFFALTRLFLPLWQEPQDHTCGTDQSKIRNIHTRAELHCTRAALGLFMESHGCRGGGGLGLVKNSFLFWYCNARVHSSLRHALHRETAEPVLPHQRQRDAGHNPPPLHC